MGKGASLYINASLGCFIGFQGYIIIWCCLSEIIFTCIDLTLRCSFNKKQHWVQCLGCHSLHCQVIAGFMFLVLSSYCYMHRDHVVYADRQWEMTLQCNVVSHWLGAYIQNHPCMYRGIFHDNSGYC